LLIIITDSLINEDNKEYTKSIKWGRCLKEMQKVQL
jgi:hypothetical protein